MACITNLSGSCEERLVQVTPSGALDCVNLVYATPSKFKAGSLEVFVDGRRLTAGLDFSENPDLMGFTIILNPLNANRLNKALRQNEDLRVDYIKSTSGSCISVL